MPADDKVMEKGCGHAGTGVGIRTGGLTVSLALLAACAAHDGASIPSSGVAPAHRKSAEARFTIKVPKKRTRRHKLKRPGFISADTQSLKLTIAPAAGGPAVISKTIGVTPTSAGCANVSGSTLCSFTENLAPGSYVVSVEAYDGLAGAGNLLSAAQRVPFTALAGRANTVALTLSGIPHTLVAQGPEPAVRVYDSGMRLYGAAAQPFTLAAKDADGESIVGPGAPRLSVALKSGNGWALATPSPQAPTTANLTPPNINGSAASVAVDAAYDDDTCSLASAVCQTSFSITNDIQTMFVSDDGSGTAAHNISIYSPVTATTPTATISTGTTGPTALGLDASLDLFVLEGQSVLEYKPPYNAGPLNTISVTAANMPTTMSVSPDGHVALADTINGTPHNVWVYAPPYDPATPPIQISGLYPAGLLFDASNDLFVSSSSHLWENTVAESVNEYKPPYNGVATGTISSGLSGPSAMAFDRQGDLFVANLLAPSVMEYAPPYATATPTTISAGMSAPWALALDYDGDLFVSNTALYGSGSAYEYSSPYSSAPTAILVGDENAFQMAVDNADNLYVVQNCQCGEFDAGGSLLGFAPPYSGSAYANTNFYNPWTVLVTP